MSNNLKELIQEERNSNTGYILIYDKYETQLKNYKRDIELKDKNWITNFELNVCKYLIDNSYYAKASSILYNLWEIWNFENLEKANQKEIKLYHKILLGLLKCNVYLKREQNAEIISKRLIDRTQFEKIEKKLIRELSYESNRRYWSKKIKWISRLSLCLILLSIILFIAAQTITNEKQILILRAGILLHIFCYIYRNLNQDYIAIDPFEIFVIKNPIRDWINEKFDLNLGYQKDIMEKASPQQCA